MRWSCIPVLIAILSVATPIRDDKVVTPEQLKAAHAAFVEAKSAGFSVESMVKLYQLDNAAPAVKKLVDAAQSNPAMSIQPADSAAMEAARETMNMAVLEHLAEVTGGTIEVINFGKQNGIRSDKDQTIFATDGKRVYTATELKEAYESHFLTTFGIDMEKMDMSMFDGDAAIPDWRRADMTYEEFVAAYEKGQAMLEQNPEAYREAGSFRAQVDRRTAEQGRVTLVRKNRESGEVEVEKGSASEVSARYKDWTADVPYRNAMDASVENRGRFDHSNDFIDKMKYFNRTVGDGVNALALENWDVNYIFHLADLSPAERKSYVDDLVRDVFVIDISPDEQELFKSIILTAAEVELDKMKSETKAESHYLRGLIESEERRAKSAGEEISPEESLKRARERFFGHQKRVMDLNIVATTRQKILRDLDPGNLKRIAAKYGDDQAKKLRYETARQIGRAFEKIDDPRLLDRLVSEAPSELRAEIESLRDVARARRKTKKSAERRPIRLADSDEDEARRTGPKEKTLARIEDESFMEARRRETTELLDAMKARYEDFDSNARAGLYSDEFITERLRNGVLESLGFEERAVLRQMEVEYERQFSGSKLFTNVVNLGNLSSVLSMIEVYQQTGDMTMVARTALWELVSNFPGVSQFATLKQSFNDGDLQSLSWLFIAWKIPGAGQAKMVFDAAKQTLTIVYNHAMVPLENDRFSQAYMGYVDAQPAGWSPLVPGWKERRDAASLSILHYVPGETFEEKRSGMYAFFQAQLHEKLVRNGFDPTTAEYWERRDQVLPAFFGSYVDRYFDARGEFFENTTVDLRAVAKIPEMKKRLIQRLQADFHQGELNDRLAEVAREEMLVAIAKIQDQQRENIDLERRVVAVEGFAVERLREGIDQLFDRVEAADDAADPGRVSVQVYPPAVVEGQEVTFAIKAMSEGEGEGGRRHQIEVRRVSATPLVRGETDLRGKLEEAVGENDVVFVKPLLDRPKTAGAELYVTKVDYEVVVKDPDGVETARETLSVKVAGIVVEEPETSEAVTLKVKVTTPPTPEEKRANPFGAKMRVHWEDPGPDNLTPRAYRPHSSEGCVPYLWLRWDDMPEGKRYGIRMKVSGGIPRFEKEWFETVYGQDRFELKDEKPGRGPCFTQHMRIPEHTGGTVEVSGELMAFEPRTKKDDMESGAATPLATFPFRARVPFFPPTHTVKAHASIDSLGILSGSVSVGYAQSGQRPGRVDVGGKSYWGKFYGGMSFRVPGAGSVPASLTVHFHDYGKAVSLSVPIENKGVKPRAKPELERRVRLLEELEWCKRADPSRYLAKMANIHGLLASIYAPNRNGWIDKAAWLAELQTQFDLMEQTYAAMGDLAWKGWGESGVPSQGRVVSTTYEPAKSAANAKAIRLDYRMLQSHVWREAAETALAMGDFGLVDRFLEKSEEFARLQSGRNLATAAHNLELTRSAHARRLYELSGDLDAARAIFALSQDWGRLKCRLNGSTFESRKFDYEVGEDFDWGPD